jgi:homeobox protein ESX1
MWAMTDTHNKGAATPATSPIRAQQVPIPPGDPAGPAPGRPVPQPPPGPTQPPPAGDPPLPGEKQPPAGDPPKEEPVRLKEVGGPAGPEPTRYGDWERKGRVSDF